MSEAVEILGLIAKNKSLPNYSAETRLDAYLCFYIEKMYPEIEFVATEFPIKKADSNQSTKVDLLCVHKETMKPIFIEFKTDSKSFNDHQAKSYADLHWNTLIEGLFKIMEASKSDYKVKYLYLINQLIKKGLISECDKFPSKILKKSYDTKADKNLRSREINNFARAREYQLNSSDGIVEVWYIAPKYLRGKMPDDINFISFNELPDNIKPKSEIYQAFIKLLRTIE